MLGGGGEQEGTWVPGRAVESVGARTLPVTALSASVPWQQMRAGVACCVGHTASIKTVQEGQETTRPVITV